MGIYRDFDDIYFLDVKDLDKEFKKLFDIDDPVFSIKQKKFLSEEYPSVPFGRLISDYFEGERISPTISYVYNRKLLKGVNNSDIKLADEMFGNGFFIKELIVPRVGILRAINKTSEYIFLALGEMVVGGLQNRVIMKDYLIPPKTIYPIDVFCVEEGRFSGKSAFDKKSVVLPSIKLIGLLSFQEDGVQKSIWGYINRIHSLLNDYSQTMDYGRLFSNFEEAMKNVDDSYNEIPFSNISGIFYSDGFNRWFLEIFGGISYPKPFVERLLKSFKFEEHLLTLKGTGRIYFRVFDKQKRLAIQTLPDGSPIKDINGRFKIFKYKDEFLKNKLKIKEAKKQHYKYNKPQQYAGNLSLEDIKKQDVVLVKLEEGILKKFLVYGKNNKFYGYLTLFKGKILHLFIGGTLEEN